MSLDEDFISKVCNAFRKAVESASEVTIEGREREFRHVLARYLFDETLGWEGCSKIGEIYDITCFDDEHFPIILIETKWVEQTETMERVRKLIDETKERLKKRIEELGSIKYGVFASNRDLIVYEYADYKLNEITRVNVAEAVGVARDHYELSDKGKRYVLKLEVLRRERFERIEDPNYFERTYKEISVAKEEGIKLLIDNVRGIMGDLTPVFMNFFDFYRKRKYHYSGRFLENTFTDWLKLSMKDEDYRKGDENEKRKIIEVFCRETAYVLLGRILFVRICEDKEILEQSLSGKRVADFLRFYERRKANIFLHAFDESREEIKNYYSHFHELGYFDWWWISSEKKETLFDNDKREQNRLEEDLNYQIKNCLRRLNRFDFTEVNRDILGDVYQGYLPSAERKRLGEFYTPKEVIEYILDAVGCKSENEITGKKILDPACGSGGFLVETIQRLIERYRTTGSNLKNPDDAKQIINECVSSIYGLDIHPFACFIAEMNLLFQLVDLYDVVRQKDRHYELPRLNVYRTDSLMPQGQSIELTEFLENSRRKMLVEETKGADKVKNIKFDYIVGNPPYVRIEKIPEEKRNYYKEKYQSAKGRFDLYMLFIERGLEWLEKNGKLGFIASNRFMKTNTGMKLRELIAQSATIEQIVDFGDISLFEAATNYPCIFVFQKKKTTDNKIWYVHVRKPEENIMSRLRNSFAKDVSDEYIQANLVEQKLLTEDVWRPLSAQINNLFKKLDKVADARLKDIAVWNLNGIFTGLNSVFILKKEIVDKYQIEPEIAKPLLVGEDVRRWKINWSGNYILYTRDIDLEKQKNTYRYLKEHQEKLSQRTSIKGTGIKWYELSRPRDPRAFECKKIVTPRIATGNNFALDENGEFYCGDTTYVIVPKDSVDIFYLLGLLNSKVLDFYLKQVSPFFMDRYFVYNASYTERFPIKLPKTLEERKITEEIIQSVDRILKLNGQLKIIEERITQFPSSYVDHNWNFDKLMNVVKAQSLSKSSYSISEKQLRTDYKQRDLDGRETFRIILAPNEFLDFYSEQIATYVLEVLKTMNSVTKQELLKLKIPQQPHLKNLLSMYQKDKEQIVKNEKAIEELEKQIDDLVYKLYGITYAERRIIEDYLKKF
jgi:type I restriction-modification system DNA methylase subunit